MANQPTLDPSKITITELISVITFELCKGCQAEKCDPNTCGLYNADGTAVNYNAYINLAENLKDFLNKNL